MIIEQMAYEKVVAEALADREKILSSSTMERLHREYHKERSRLKIRPTDQFQKFYDIKTHRKNTWIISFRKQGTLAKDTSTECVMYVYFYTSKGLRVISIDIDGGVLIFNSHVFKRWNERLNLGIVQPLDMVKDFFVKNYDLYFKVFNKETQEIFGIVEGGFILGQKIDSKHSVVKTFINRELAYGAQMAIEEELIKFINKDKLSGIVKRNNVIEF
jgi:hypothetical protein